MVVSAARRMPSPGVAGLARLDSRAARVLGYLLLTAGSLLVWQVIHKLAGANLVPSPAAVLGRAEQLARTGVYQESIFFSAERILLGWLVGCAVAVPIGLVMAQVPLVRRVLEPYLHFFRFIPPIAFVSLALIWFGLGELSKIVLIVYTTSFTVTVATVAGALAVHREKVWAARCLGASNRQLLFSVLMPATVPSVVTGMRLGMANSFKTIVGAEMIGARSGLGFMIWNARAFLDTESIFLGIVTLALMGLAADLLLRALLRPIAQRYGGTL